MSAAVSRVPEPLLSVPPCSPSPAWVLPDVIVPESNPHRYATDQLRLILEAWIARTQRCAQVVSNLAVRWDPQNPAVGLDPDVALLDPPPPEGEAVGSLRLWNPGHHVPPLAIEIVSPSNPYKDYQQAPLKYASLGVTELWIVDPERRGPAALGGPYPLQIWSRPAGGGLTRIFAGEAPAYSPYLDAWLVLRRQGLLVQVRIADDREGRQLWPTPEEVALQATEVERQAKETERQAKEAALQVGGTERQAKEAALARIAELEAELADARKR